MVANNQFLIWLYSEPGAAENERQAIQKMAAMLSSINWHQRARVRSDEWTMSSAQLAEGKAENRMLIANFANQLSAMIVASVLHQSYSTRVVALERWIWVAYQAYRGGDSHTATQIYSAVGNASIFRLSATKASLSKEAKMVWKLLHVVKENTSRETMKQGLHETRYADGTPGLPYAGDAQSAYEFGEKFSAEQYLLELDNWMQTVKAQAKNVTPVVYYPDAIARIAEMQADKDTSNRLFSRSREIESKDSQPEAVENIARIRQAIVSSKKNKLAESYLVYLRQEKVFTVLLQTGLLDSSSVFAEGVRKLYQQLKQSQSAIFKASANLLAASADEDFSNRLPPSMKLKKVIGEHTRLLEQMVEMIKASSQTPLSVSLKLSDPDSKQDYTVAEICQKEMYRPVLASRDEKISLLGGLQDEINVLRRFMQASEVDETIVIENISAQLALVEAENAEEIQRANILSVQSRLDKIVSALSNKTLINNYMAQAEQQAARLRDAQKALAQASHENLSPRTARIELNYKIQAAELEAKEAIIVPEDLAEHFIQLEDCRFALYGKTLLANFYQAALLSEADRQALAEELEPRIKAVQNQLLEKWVDGSAITDEDVYTFRKACQAHVERLNDPGSEVDISAAVKDHAVLESKYLAIQHYCMQHISALPSSSTEVTAYHQCLREKALTLQELGKMHGLINLHRHLPDIKRMQERWELFSSDYPFKTEEALILSLLSETSDAVDLDGYLDVVNEMDAELNKIDTSLKLSLESKSIKYKLKEQFKNWREQYGLDTVGQVKSILYGAKTLMLMADEQKQLLSDILVSARTSETMREKMLEAYDAKHYGEFTEFAKEYMSYMSLAAKLKLKNKNRWQDITTMISLKDQLPMVNQQLEQYKLIANLDETRCRETLASFASLQNWIQDAGDFVLECEGALTGWHDHLQAISQRLDAITFPTDSLVECREAALKVDMEYSEFIFSIQHRLNIIETAVSLLSTLLGEEQANELVGALTHLQSQYTGLLQGTEFRQDQASLIHRIDDLEHENDRREAEKEPVVHYSKADQKVLQDIMAVVSQTQHYRSLWGRLRLITQPSESIIDSFRKGRQQWRDAEVRYQAAFKRLPVVFSRWLVWYKENKDQAPVSKIAKEKHTRDFDLYARFKRSAIDVFRRDKKQFFKNIRVQRHSVQRFIKKISPVIQEYHALIRRQQRNNKGFEQHSRLKRDLSALRERINSFMREASANRSILAVMGLRKGEARNRIAKIDHLLKLLQQQQAEVNTLQRVFGDDVDTTVEKTAVESGCKAQPTVIFSQPDALTRGFYIFDEANEHDDFEARFGRAPAAHIKAVYLAMESGCIDSKLEADDKQVHFYKDTLRCDEQEKSLRYAGGTHKAITLDDEITFVRWMVGRAIEKGFKRPVLSGDATLVEEAYIEFMAWTKLTGKTFELEFELGSKDSFDPEEADVTDRVELRASELSKLKLSSRELNRRRTRSAREQGRPTRPD